MVSSTLCPAVYILGPKMCTAGQRVSLTITAPGPSFLLLFLHLLHFLCHFSSFSFLYVIPPHLMCLFLQVQIIAYSARPWITRFSLLRHNVRSRLFSLTHGNSIPPLTRLAIARGFNYCMTIFSRDRATLQERVYVRPSVRRYVCM